MTLCAVPEALDCIVLDTAQGPVVLNYEDAGSTAHLDTALVDFLESKGLEVSVDAG